MRTREKTPPGPRDREGGPPPGVVWRRVLACLIDCLLLGAASAAIMLPALPLVEGMVRALLWAAGVLVVFCVLYTLYVVLLDGLYGGTLGKRAAGVRVVTVPEGARPGPWRAALRALTFLATDGLLGLFFVLRSPTGQRPGDMVTRTAVVRRRPSG